MLILMWNALLQNTGDYIWRDRDLGCYSNKVIQICRLDMLKLKKSNLAASKQVQSLKENLIIDIKHNKKNMYDRLFM